MSDNAPHWCYRTMTETPSPQQSRRSYLKATALASTLGLSALAGCTGGGDEGNEGGGDGGNKLEVVHWWTAGGEKAALNALLEGFGEEYPDVEVENNPAPGGAGSALDTVVKNRVLNENPPSTFQIWPGKALAPYTESDTLNTLTESVWSSEMQDNYLGGVKDAAKANGEFVAVPINIHRLNNLFYNVDVVKQAGVDPASISDPKALVDAFETVASETDAVPMAQQTQSPWSTLQLWEAVFIGEHGTDAFLDLLSGNVAAHESAVKSSLTTVTEYEQYFNDDAGSIAWDQANGKIVNGDAAFIQQGDWAAGQYRAAENFEYDSQWGKVPFPGTEGVYTLVMDSFVFPKNNPSPAATEKFLKYCGSVDAQKRFNREKGSIPPRTDVPTDAFGPFLTKQIEDFKNSDTQPPTIAHGTGVTPEVKSSVEQAFSGFTEQWDVAAAYEGIKSAFE